MVGLFLFLLNLLHFLIHVFVPRYDVLSEVQVEKDIELCQRSVSEGKMGKPSGGSMKKNAL